jgi:hypothetical protein
MTIKDAIKLLKSLTLQTEKKSEQKIYICFIRTLTSLEKKDLTDSQLHLIQEKLSSLNLNTTTENSIKHFKKQLPEFKAFLKSEFSFTSEKYYTEIGMIYGMCFGVAIGLSIGVAINQVIGASIGLSIGIGVGMLFGILYGAKKDAEAKYLGRVI